MLRLLPVVFLILLTSCSAVTDPEEHQHIAEISARAVEVIDATPQQVDFSFEGMMPDPCHEFKDAHVVSREDTISVKVRAQSTLSNGGGCIAVIDTLTVSPLSVSVQGSGTYIFAFWRWGEEKPLELEVTVP